MANWNELWQSARVRKRFAGPEADVHRFVGLLEAAFPADRPLRIWDLCCGSGRHTVLVARLGHQAYATDDAAQAVELTGRAVAAEGLEARTEVAEMEVCPWREGKFHGVVAWDAIHHNTLAGIEQTMTSVYEALLPGGLLLATLLSDKAGSCHKGRQVEDGTFVNDTGDEAGVPHHFFDEQGVRKLLDRFELLILAEEVTRYVATAERFWEWTPFRFTKWNVLARKPDA